ncbi:MAG: hypothetical protein KIY12_04285 [Thermoplasmata archaeon]|uniref:Uncharacterized protein n=1 Tax=Candidatus Sysuiplasma superficiale TaxID=2823368 RepID=A0A8J7YWZ1_9ARCH|nr:hypothetical protein [Candidatus Sysuiplasma superficiale]MBX8643926.1 hypothetical protein [Candidatus Sysuiplasma superficiale]MCL4346340.1 hypothetical protein [Candidatus Thermoplasmatota archaeon]
MTLFSIYVHPWDVADEGASTLLDYLCDAGINELNLATSYHSGRFILPHNPTRRVYWAEEGVVYFAPSGEYRETPLRPRRCSEYSYSDILDSVCNGAADRDIGVNSWAVCLHNSAFASVHKNFALIDAFGTSDRNMLCPSHTETRNYIFSLVDDIARHSVRSIKLESAFFPQRIEHGDHHEVFGVNVDEVASLLLTVCFCDSCVKRARDFGLNLNECRSQVRGIIDRHISGAAGSTSLKMNEEEADIIERIGSFRRNTAREILAEARDHAHSAGVRLDCILSPPRCNLADVRLPDIADTVDGTDVLLYYPSVKDVATGASEAGRMAAGRCDLSLVLRITFPFAYTPDRISDCIDSCVNAGADGVAFYNYGWATSELLSALAVEVRRRKVR